MPSTSASINSRPLAPVPLVDDVEEHVGRIGPVGEIADLIDDEDDRMRVRRQRIRELAGAEGGREIIDQCRRGREESIEAVLDRTVGDGDRQMRFPAARFAGQNQRAALGDEIRGEAEPSMCSRSDD